MPSLSIVIPVKNERENIKTALNAIFSQVKYDFELLIIYDTDDDNTLPEIRKIDNIRLIKNKYSAGALNAIKTGLEESQSPYVIVTMADLSDPPKVMNDMLRNAELEGSDIVCASRYMKGGSHTGGPFIKGLMSRTACLTLHWLAGLPTHDATNSFKLYRKSFLDTVIIESTGGFELGLELVVKAYSHGLKISEVPSSWTDRTKGRSHFKILSWLAGYLRWYFYAFIHRKKAAS